MRRLLLSFLALTMVSSGRIPTLGPSQDINDAVNLSGFVFVPWGGTNLVGIDEIKRRLIRCGYDSPYYLSSQKVVLMENLPYGSRLLAAEIDSHPGPELILLAENRCHIWSSGIRTADRIAPDISFDLPAIQRNDASPPVVADFDGDGVRDLLLPASGRILFSFGTANAATIALPDLPTTRISTARPWRTGGPPVVVFEDPTSEHPTTTVIEYKADRTSQIVETFDGADFLADLDGIAPPERIRLDHWNTGSIPSRVLVIRQKTGGAWNTAVTLPYPAANPIFDGPHAIEDFDQDGRQELILTSSSYQNSPDPPLSDFWKISAAGGTAEATVERTGGISGQLMKIEPVWLPQPKQFGLAQFQSSTALSDALGNPTSLWGTGIRTILSNQPLNARSPSTWNLSLNDIPTDLAATTLGEDGKPALVVVGKSGSAIYHTGSFFAPDGGKKTSVGISVGVNGMEIAELNGDGIPDSLFAGAAALVSVHPHRDADGSANFNDFSPSVIFKNFNAPAPNRLLGTADFDGDGDNDALILQGGEETMAWSPNNGAGSFSEPHPIALAGREYRIPGMGGTGSYQWITQRQTLILDADHDGDPDIITLPSALGARLALHRNQSGTFTLEPFGPAFSAFPGMWDFFTHTTNCTLKRGKFQTSANDLQIVLLAPGATGFGDPGIRVFLIGGTPGEVTVSNPIDLPHAAIAIAADFDSDGIDDFITATAPETDFLGNPVGGPAILFHRNRGNGSVDPPLALAAPTGFVSNLKVADLNGDGKPDLIAASKETGNVDVYLQQGVDPLPSYQNWIARFEVADASPHADPDGDGMVNLLEYASGTAPGPLRSPASPLKPAPVGPGITFPWPWQAEAVHARPRQTEGSRLDIGIESSTDLAHWQPVVATPTIGSSFESPEWEVLHWQFQTESEDPPPPRFYRFRVSNPDGP